MSPGAKKSVQGYYTRHPGGGGAGGQDFHKEIKKIKNLTAKEQNDAIKIVEKRLQDSTDPEKTRGWKLEAVLDVSKTRLVYIDQSGIIRARKFRKGRFTRVPQRFRSEL